MTAQRQERYGSPVGKAFLALLAGFFASICLDLPGGGLSALAATTERVVVNRFSGLAIEGFDPVAYFTDSIAIQGVPDFEASESGAVWRFRNEGNRASFVAHPEVYGPQFGGYDPVDMARGVAVAGVPRLWMVHAQRLYLFSREDSRAAFAADPDQVLHSAVAAWPRVRDSLAE